MRRVLLALALAPLAACLFPDLGDLTGDGGAPDVAQTDGPSANDASQDASDATPVDAGDGGGYCATLGGTHALCEDFDEDGGFAANFPQTFVSPKATLGTDTSASTSPPQSLLARTSQGGTSETAYVQRAFTSTATTSITYAFDVRFDSWTTNNQSGVFAAIVLDDGQPDFHVLSVYTTSAYTALEESFREPDGGTAYVDHTFSSPLQLGAWRRLAITIDLANMKCSATLDGTAVVSPTAMDPSWKTGVPPTITLGFTYVASQTQPWQARYDDVVFDFQ